jgi:hypothetical protein
MQTSLHLAAKGSNLSAVAERANGLFSAFPRLRPRRAERRGTLNLYHKMGTKLPKKYGQANMDKTGRIAKKVKFWENNAKFCGTYTVSFVSYIVCQKDSS